MNMLFVLEAARGQGIGTKLVAVWEARMREVGCPRIMTSTQANESAQHFYRKLGYVDAGTLLLPGEPLEIVLIKDLNN
jgi:GNAT superfamily N-acetyltransferase